MKHEISLVIKIRPEDERYNSHITAKAAFSELDETVYKNLEEFVKLLQTPNGIKKIGNLDADKEWNDLVKRTFDNDPE